MLQTASNSPVRQVHVGNRHGPFQAFLRLFCPAGVDSYTDNAVGVMEKNAAGRLAITRVTLRPKIVFTGAHQPTAAQIAPG